MGHPLLSEGDWGKALIHTSRSEAYGRGEGLGAVGDGAGALGAFEIDQEQAICPGHYFVNGGFSGAIAESGMNELAVVKLQFAALLAVGEHEAAGFASDVEGLQEIDYGHLGEGAANTGGVGGFAGGLAQRDAVQNTLDPGDGIVDEEWLFDELFDQGAGARKGAGDVGAGGEDDNGYAGEGDAQFGEQFQTAQAGHSVVRDDEVGGLFLRPAKCLGGAGKRMYRRQGRNRCDQQFADHGIVIHQQNIYTMSHSSQLPFFKG